MKETNFVSRKSAKQMLKEVSKEKNLVMYYVRMFLSKKYINLYKTDILCSLCSTISYLQDSLRRLLATEGSEDKMDIPNLEVLILRAYYREYEKFKGILLNLNVSLSLH
jgi:hypothetical protein